MSDSDHRPFTARGPLNASRFSQYPTPRVAQIENLQRFEVVLTKESLHTTHGGVDPIEMTAELREIMPNDEPARRNSIPDQFGIEVDVLFVMGRIDENHSQILERSGNHPSRGVGKILNDIFDVSITVVGSDVLLRDEVRDHPSTGRIILVGQDVDRVTLKTG